MTAPAVIVVAFPTEVTGPVRFASVVTVAALPDVFEVIVAEDPQRRSNECAGAEPPV